MPKMIPFLYKKDSIVFNYDGKTHILNSTAVNFQQVVNAIKRKDWDQVLECLDIKKAIKLASFGRIDILDDGKVTLDGKEIHKVLQDRINTMFSQNLYVEPLTKFTENVYLNPNQSSRDELYLFLEHNNLPLTEDGCFLAYKIVKENYLDCFSETIDNSIGSHPKMERSLVNADRTVTCSTGLHVCSEDYLPYYGAFNGTRVVVAKVNPKDVVSVPVDYNNAKMRVCEYEVVGELQNWMKITPEFTTEYSNKFEEDSNPEFDEEDEDDSWDEFFDTDEESPILVNRQKLLNFPTTTSLPAQLTLTPLTHIEELAVQFNVSQEKIREILTVKKMGKEGFSKSMISKTVDLSERQIGRILSGEAWKGIE